MENNNKQTQAQAQARAVIYADYSDRATNYLDRRWEETKQELERFEAKMKGANHPGQRAFYVTEYARAVIYADYLQAEIVRINGMTLAQLASEYIPSTMECLLRYSPLSSSSAFHNASDMVALEVQKEALQIARNVLEMSKD